MYKHAKARQSQAAGEETNPQPQKRRFSTPIISKALDCLYQRESSQGVGKETNLHPLKQNKMNEDELLHCRDCQYYRPQWHECCFGGGWGHYPDPDDVCVRMFQDEELLTNKK